MSQAGAVGGGGERRRGEKYPPKYLYYDALGVPAFVDGGAGASGT
jgi:hypothetical protein